MHSAIRPRGSAAGSEAPQGFAEPKTEFSAGESPYKDAEKLIGLGDIFKFLEDIGADGSGIIGDKLKVGHFSESELRAELAFNVAGSSSKALDGVFSGLDTVDGADVDLAEGEVRGEIDLNDGDKT